MTKETENLWLSIKNLSKLYKEEASYLVAEELEDVFLETNLYKDAISPDLPFLFLIGDKGTGKSTIFQKISHTKPDEVVGIYFKLFYFAIKEKVEKKYPDDPLNYLHYQDEWTIELWAQVIRKLYNVHKDSRLVPIDFFMYKKLFSFAEKHDLLDEPPWTQEVLDTLGIAKFSFEGKDGKLIINASQPSKNELDSPAQITILDTIVKLLQKHPVFLIVDEVDAVGTWDPSVKNSLLGLFLASQTLIRTVTQYHKSQKGALKIRIAMRDEMLKAATEDYVDSEKLPNQSIHFAWSENTLEDLITRPIRAAWDIPDIPLPKEKIFYSVFPSSINQDNKNTLKQLCAWSKNNPRALVGLIRKSLDKSINRQGGEAKYEPLCVTSKDIIDVSYLYSEERLGFLEKTYNFIFPEIKSLIRFIKDNSRMFRKGVITRKTLAKHISTFLETNSVIVDAVTQWPDSKYPIEEEIIRRLYNIGLLGMIIKSDEIYIPETYIDIAPKFAVAPMYRPYILGQLLEEDANYVIETIELHLDDFVATIDYLKSILKLPSKTKFPEEGVLTDLQDNHSSSIFVKQNIRYLISKLFWSICNFRKVLIAFSHHKDLEKYPIHQMLETLDELSGEICKQMDLDIKSMNILAVLMSSANSGTISQEEFITNLETGSEQDVYKLYAEKIFSWVKKAQNSRKRNTIVNEMGRTLDSLRTELSRFMLDTEDLL
jgi:hypothetical protein